jgi:hypothetical protein
MKALLLTLVVGALIIFLLIAFNHAFVPTNLQGCGFDEMHSEQCVAERS